MATWHALAIFECCSESFPGKRGCFDGRRIWFVSLYDVTRSLFPGISAIHDSHGMVYPGIPVLRDCRMAHSCSVDPVAKTISGGRVGGYRGHWSRHGRGPGHGCSGRLGMAGPRSLLWGTCAQLLRLVADCIRDDRIVPRLF